jgi:hypothetical protein
LLWLRAAEETAARCGRDVGAAFEQQADHRLNPSTPHDKRGGVRFTIARVFVGAMRQHSISAISRLRRGVMRGVAVGIAGIRWRHGQQRAKISMCPSGWR